MRALGMPRPEGHDAYNARLDMLGILELRRLAAPAVTATTSEQSPEASQSDSIEQAMSQQDSAELV